MSLICLKTLRASGRWCATACLLAACLLPAQAWAQGQATDSPPPGSPAPVEEPLDLPSTFDGPPPPVPPAVVSRDDSGKATVRAVRLATPLQIDGRLDEVLYDTVPPISDFLQVEPRPGEPATDRTDVWVTFERNNFLCVAPLLAGPRPDRGERHAARLVQPGRLLRYRPRHVPRRSQRRRLHRLRLGRPLRRPRSPTRAR